MQYAPVVRTRETDMTRSNEAYLVVARVGEEIESFVRFGRWNADMKATELRRQHPDAEIKIARIPNQGEEHKG